MEQVLLLNITFEPLKVINWKKAIIMLTLGKVEVIEEYTQGGPFSQFRHKVASSCPAFKVCKKANDTS